MDSCVKDSINLGKVHHYHPLWTLISHKLCPEEFCFWLARDSWRAYVCTPHGVNSLIFSSHPWRKQLAWFLSKENMRSKGSRAFPIISLNNQLRMILKSPQTSYCYWKAQNLHWNEKFDRRSEANFYFDQSHYWKEPYKISSLWIVWEGRKICLTSIIKRFKCDQCLPGKQRDWLVWHGKVHERVALCL